MKIQELKKAKEVKVTQLMNECKMFFAFSNDQFLENKTELKEGEKYVSFGAGAYLPKSYVNTWVEGMKVINNWYKSEVKSNKLRGAEILAALHNHECFYTGDWTEAFYSLGEGYTNEEVQEVYLNNKNLVEF